MTETKPWGDTIETVADWCKLPINWTGKEKAGFRFEPVIGLDEALGIAQLVVPEWGTTKFRRDSDRGELLQLAEKTDSTQWDLNAALERGDEDEILNAGYEYQDALDDFYGLLRELLWPNRVKAEHEEILRRRALLSDDQKRALAAITGEDIS